MACRSTERKKKAWLDELKDKSACADCGFDDPRALHLHHVDPATKNPRLRGARAKDLVSLSYVDLAAELAKCEIVCANCHMIRHCLLKQTPTVRIPVKP